MSGELPEHVRRNRAHWDPQAAGIDAIEVGCGTAYVSAWLARRGARPWRGSDPYGQLAPPASVAGPAGTASAAAAGQFSSCAIRNRTGAVVCRGNDASGQASPPPAVDGTAGTARTIDASMPGTAARSRLAATRRSAGEPTPTVRRWPPVGERDGRDRERDRRRPVPHLRDPTRDRRGVCWGANTYEQASPPPSVNGTSGSALAISAGEFHGCAIPARTRAVVCWGGLSSVHVTPPAVLDGVQGQAGAIAAGAVHTLAIRTDECSNGLDDDGDGLADHPEDPGCASPTDLSEQSPALPCDDGIDNDGDGLIDWNGSPPDPQWVDAPWRNREAASASALGAELALLVPVLGAARRWRRARSVRDEAAAAG